MTPGKSCPRSTRATSARRASTSSPGPSSAPTCGAGRRPRAGTGPSTRRGRAVKKDSDMYLALDVLAREVGIRGMFSDWPATVTYYANCMGAELQQIAPMDEQP